MAKFTKIFIMGIILTLALIREAISSSCPMQRRHAGFSAPSPSATRASTLASLIEKHSHTQIRERRQTNNNLFNSLFFDDIFDNNLGSSSFLSTFFGRRNQFARVPLQRQVVDRRRLNSRFRSFASFSQSLLDSAPVCNEERAEMECSESARYRTYSGRCNNLRNSHFGKHTIPLRRLLRPKYDDRISRVRSRSADGINPLPNPRLVSTRIHHNGTAIDHRHTSMLMQFGQFLDHDISSTPMIRDENNEVLDCSDCDTLNPACNPIPVPLGDVFFPTRHLNRVNQSLNCIPFTRSMPGQLSSGPREQLNQITSYLDSSHIYGSDICRANVLRTEKGRMRTSAHPMSHVFKHFLPTNNTVPECEASQKQCFFSGDDRNNEQPGLTSLHTLFVREHNRLALKLSALNPHWSSDQVFEETRRIVAAINQNIIYSEFLPRVLGSKLMRHFDLVLEKDGSYYDGYDERCEADVSNAFATAAFRFGHSLIQPSINLRMDHESNKESIPDNKIRLREHFNNPDIFKHTAMFVDAAIRGLASTPMQSADRAVTNELTNHLFQHVANPLSGMDLAALNIQRGRDHGLPGYVHYQRMCAEMLDSKSAVNSFEDLRNVMEQDNLDVIRATYRHIEDVDLFTGGLSERKASSDALVGNTFGCIIGEQFRRLRKCDRYWFENDRIEMAFSKDQLREIKKVKLASILCQNCDMNMKMQREVFDVVDEESNPEVDCQTQHHSLDVSPWLDENEEKKEKKDDIKDDKEKKDKNEDVQIGRRRSGRRLSDLFCEFNGRAILPRMSVRISACVKCTCDFGHGHCETLNFDCKELIDDVGADAVRVDTHCSRECRNRALNEDQNENDEDANNST